jgi:type II secretory pathway pseudopilin PulG
MRWKLLRRRLSVSAPRMIVRSRLPWPLRWALAAVMLGFSAALALWAFQFGKEIAGLDRDARHELQQLRGELQQLRTEHAQARQVADTAESLLKTERAAQEGLVQQLRQAEAAREALRADLGFFERLLPTQGEGLQLRGLQADVTVPGQLRYQLLVVQNAKAAAEFSGRYDIVLGGTLDGRPWSQPLPGGALPLRLQQYLRLQGAVDHPVGAVIKTVLVRVVDQQGTTRATQSVKPMP